MIECRRCSEKKPEDAFRVHKNRGIQAICKRCEAAYQVEYRKTHPETRNRPSQYQRCKDDPERLSALNAKRRADWKDRRSEDYKEYHRKRREKDPLAYRAFRARHNVSKEITVEWVREMWKLQSGKCALTGRQLTEDTFQIDHILPRSRGGSDALENLRLVSPEANAAKSHLTDEELLALCLDVLETMALHCGPRLQSAA